jgi:hypothetical protein
MEIKVLGPGCPNCSMMEELGIEAKIDKVTDIKEIMKFTMSTPALVINGELKHSGKPLPTLNKVKELIKAEV